MEACLLGGLSSVGVLLDEAVDSCLDSFDLSVDCFLLSHDSVGLAHSAGQFQGSV